MSDQVICKDRRVWSFMTPNVLTETSCHGTAQTLNVLLYENYVRGVYVLYKMQSYFQAHTKACNLCFQ